MQDFITKNFSVLELRQKLRGHVTGDFILQLDDGKKTVLLNEERLLGLSKALMAKVIRHCRCHEYSAEIYCIKMNQKLWVTKNLYNFKLQQGI